MKRKNIIILMTIILCLTSLHLNISFAEESSPAFNKLLFDIDADGKITLDDAQAVLSIALGITEIKDIESEQKQFTLDDAYYVLTLALGIPSSNASTSEGPAATTLPVESIEPDTTQQPEESSNPIPTATPTRKPRPTKHPEPTLEPWPTSDPSVTPIPPEITITEEELSQIDFVEVYKAAIEIYDFKWFAHVCMDIEQFVCTDENETKEIYEYLDNTLGEGVLIHFDDFNELFAQNIVYYWSNHIWKFRNQNGTIFYINVREVHENKIIMETSLTQGGIDAQGYTLTLEKQEDQWVVVDSELTGLS